MGESPTRLASSNQYPAYKILIIKLFLKHYDVNGITKKNLMCIAHRDINLKIKENLS